MGVPLMDLRGQWEPLHERILEAVGEVVRSGVFILGPNVKALEAETAADLGVAHAVGVANGTDALILALRAYGIGAGDEVVCPAYTFYATPESIAAVGATPVFADIDPGTYQLDPASVEAAITPRTRAIMAVHLFGHPAPMRELRAIADAHGLVLIEDAAQAYGASLDGVRCGAIGDVATFSFFPTKNLGGFGDGGLVATDDAEIAERVRELRFHGSKDKRTFTQVGMNSRLDELQAAILRVLLPELAGWNASRRTVADRYAELGLGRFVELPATAAGAEPIYHLYVVRCGDRDAVQAALKDADVGSVVYYDTPHHLQPVFAELGYAEGSLPETERAARECLALPMYPTLPAADQATLVGALEAALAPTA
ncbi:MAG: DegT/DnrJ/EryC1/StrS family aminotransferase [Gaiellales bacterium]